MSDRRILVFAKAPEPGRVKTRLVPALTPDQAAAVHEAALRDVVAGAREVHADVRIQFDPTPGAADYFSREFSHVESRPQSGGDLGQRLEQALGAAFEDGAAGVIAIGADSPTLPAGYLISGIQSVSDADVTIGPAVDGGYYLSAVRRSAWPEASALFRDIPWSTSDVFARTLERAAALRLRLKLLEPWYDIDRIDDLRLARVHACRDSHLARFLRATNLPCSRATAG